MCDLAARHFKRTEVHTHATASLPGSVFGDRAAVHGEFGPAIRDVHTGAAGHIITAAVLGDAAVVHIERAAHLPYTVLGVPRNAPAVQLEPARVFSEHSDPVAADLAAVHGKLSVGSVEKTYAAACTGDIAAVAGFCAVGDLAVRGSTVLAAVADRERTAADRNNGLVLCRHGNTAPIEVEEGVGRRRPRITGFHILGQIPTARSIGQRGRTRPRHIRVLIAAIRPPMGAGIAADGVYVLLAIGYQQLAAAARQSAGAVIIVDREDAFVRVRQGNARSRLGKGYIIICAGHRLQRNANSRIAAGKTAGNLDGRVVGQIDVAACAVDFIILDLHSVGEPERAAVAHKHASALGSAGRGCIGDRIVDDLRVTGHGESAAVHMHTAAALDLNVVCVAGDRIICDRAASHGQCAIVAHIHAAAGYDGTVSVDLAAVHGKGTIIVHKHATAVCRDIALDGTAVHSEGTLIHIYARAIIIWHTIAADGAAVHVERTAVVYYHAPADVRTTVRDDAAVDCKRTILVQDPPVAVII